MNFLEALAGRARETVAILEPPRIPFVNVFPDGGGEAGPGAAVAVPGQPAVALSGERTGRWRESTEPRPAVAIETGEQPRVERTIDAAPRNPGAPRAPIAPAPTTVERVIERRLIDAVPAGPPAITPTAAATPRAPAPTPITAIEERWLREVRETRVEHTEHSRERVIAPAPAPPAPPPSAAPAPPSEPRRAPAPPRVPVPVPVPPPPWAGALPATASPPPPPATAPPPVHVSIGRIVVHVQAPPAPARGDRVRPAAPAVDLEAYNAARRGDNRGNR